MTISIQAALADTIISPFGLIYILMLTKWRLDKKVTITMSATFISILTVLNLIFVQYMDVLLPEYPYLDFAFRIFNVLAIAVVILSLVKQKLSQVIFVILSACVFVLIAGTICSSIQIITGFNYIELPLKLTLLLFILSIIYYTRDLFFEVVNYMQKGWWFLCLIPAFLLCCFFFLVSAPIPLKYVPGNIPAALILCVTAGIIYVIFFFILYGLRRQALMEQSVITMQSFIHALEHQNEITLQNAKKVSLFRHDLKHVIAMLHTSLDQKDISTVKKLIDSIDENVDRAWGTYVFESLTNNVLLDTAISYYIGTAREAGIDITVRMNPVDKPDVDKMEFAVVIANALENAINACKKQPEGEARIIRVEGSQKGKQFYLEIANTYVGKVVFDEETGRPISKEENHGLGSQTIVYFAKKNHGILHFRLEENWFYFNLLL